MPNSICRYFLLVLGNVNESRNFVEKTLLDGVTILHFEHLLKMSVTLCYPFRPHAATGHLSKQMQLSPAEED